MRRPSILTATCVLALGACTASGTVDEDTESSDQATQLAEQLNGALEAAGFEGLDVTTATRLYGTDGGWTCAVVGDLDHRMGVHKFGNAGRVHTRLYMDPEVVARDFEVISTYCPDELDGFREVIDDLGLAETIPDT